MNNYSEKLNSLFGESKFSYRELGMQSGLSKDGIQKILCGDGDAKVSSLEALCESFGISMAQLFCKHDEIVLKTTPDIKALYVACMALPAPKRAGLLHFINTMLKE